MGFNSEEWAGEDKKSKYGANRVWLPRNIGDSIIVRFLPPVGSMKRPWSYYKLHKLTFQTFKSETPVTRRIVCLDQFISFEERQNRPKLNPVIINTQNAKDPETLRNVMAQIEVLKNRCPLDALAKQLELNYFVAKAEGRPQEVVNGLWKKYMDAQVKGLYFYNVVTKDGTHAILEAKSHVHNVLEGALKQKAKELNLGIFSTKDNGVWIKITKVTEGQKTGNFSVEFNTFEKVIEGTSVSVRDTTPIKPEILDGLEKSAVDLDRYYDNSIISKKDAMQIFLNQPIEFGTKPSQSSTIATTITTASTTVTESYSDDSNDSLDDIIDTL